MFGRPGLACEGLDDQRGLILDCAGPAATHLVVETLDPISDETIAAFANRRDDTKPGRHHAVARLALAVSTIFARNVSLAGSERDRVIVVENREHPLRPPFASGTSFNQDIRKSMQ
jgi:hypothetical protein